jgi:hypothetical protein
MLRVKALTWKQQNKIDKICKKNYVLYPHDKQYD